MSSTESEQYYSEISNAIYDNDNQEYLLNVLDKYGIDYVWIDGWVINPQKPAMLDMSQVERWLINGGFEKSFVDGKQTVYKRIIPVDQIGLKSNSVKQWSGNPITKVVNEDYESIDFVRIESNVYEKADLPRYVTIIDNSEKVYGYESKNIENVSISNPESEKIYDFETFFPALQYDERTWWMREIYIAYQSEKGAELRVCLTKKDVNDCYFIGTDTNENGGYRWGKFVMKDTTSPSEIKFEIIGNVEMKEIRFGYFNIPISEKTVSQFVDSTAKTLKFNLVDNQVVAKNCYQFGKGEISRDVIIEGEKTFVRYSARDASSCESMLLTDSTILSQGGQISLRTRNINGRPIKFCLRHDPPGDCLVEEIVKGNKNEWKNNVYRIPPATKQGELYLEIDDYAVGKEQRINDVGEVWIVGKPEEQRLDTVNSDIYSNNQAFRSGWIGVDLRSLKVLDHVKVDGWANGWIVPQSVEATIFYWPQLLEYLGFVMFGTTIFIVVFRKK